MIRRPPRSTQSRSSAASDVYKRQVLLARDKEVRVGTYVLRRLLQMIPVFFGATFLIFYLVLGMPGDPLASMCGERGCDPATAVALRACLLYTSDAADDLLCVDL